MRLYLPNSIFLIVARGLSLLLVLTLSWQVATASTGGTGDPVTHSTTSFTNVCGLVAPVLTPASITVTAGTPVSITATGCPGGIIQYFGSMGVGTVAPGSAISVPTSTTGTLILSALCSASGCTSDASVATITVKPASGPSLAPVVSNTIATQTATVGSTFVFLVPSTTFSDPKNDPLTLTASGLPSGFFFNGAAIIGPVSTTGTSTITITATNSKSLSVSTSFQFVASGTAISGPATLTITSFNCNVANVGTGPGSVSFVVGYSDGTFLPSVPALFINGVTASGQLGIPYTLTFDANSTPVAIQDQATRSTYFVWNYRTACATPGTPMAPAAPFLPNQVATQGAPFSYVVPAFTGTAPVSYSATGLPAGLIFNAATRTISGTPTTVQTSTVVVSASNVAGLSSGTFTIGVSASATAPATLTITSFNCNIANAGTGPGSVSFVVGYSNGTFTPALPPLLIIGVTASGQLGTSYSFPFDANASTLSVQDLASRSTYFVWNFRAACATPGTPVSPAPPALPNQVATQGAPFSYVVPAFTGTAPVSYSATGLPAGLIFNAATRTISGTPTTVQTSTVVVSASNVAGLSSGTFTIGVSASATAPATLTITSFNCNIANAGTGPGSVSFVVGYSNGTFTPALPPLLIIGTTANGQLGTSYTFPFDANVSALSIQDLASRSTYFVWNFRAACAARGGGRLLAEPTALLKINIFGNPIHDLVEFDVIGAEGNPVSLMLTDLKGTVIGQQQIERAGLQERVRFNVNQQPAGLMLLRATTPQQSQAIRLLKTK